ncbi:MAG TPA: ribonuclease H-like domain-containing protein [Candidatus Limnocylindrales bacterium]|nr:ribonuclease H-like domain-containing protein [Candidatus Limnocylindrales bacterium]
MISASLRQRIGNLLRRESHPEPVEEPRQRRIVPTSIEEILPGGMMINREGAVFVHERLYTELNERPIPLLKRFEQIGRLPDADDESLAPTTLREAVEALDPPERGLFRKFGHRRMLFLDIETCGLQSAPVFLVGLCHIGDRNLVLRQLFARDYAEERSLLAEVERILGEHDFLVTYNGKTFDLPFLRHRAVYNRMRFETSIPHLDLLWMVRRRWRERLPNCKLQTLEWHVLRRLRAGDIDGSQIPGAYHEYVKNGQPHRLLPVFHHNLLDLVAMAELLPRLFEPDENPAYDRGERFG